MSTSKAAARRRLRALATTALTLTLATFVAAGDPSGSAADLGATPAPYRTLEHRDSVPAAHTHTVPGTGAEAALRSKARRIATSAPAEVESNTTILVSGVVEVRSGSAARRRPVRLLEATPQGWKRLTQGRSARSGSFRFKVSAGSTPRDRFFRVVAPRTKGVAGARTGRFRVRVLAPEAVPPPTETAPVSDPEAPRGSPDDWSFLFADRGGARWNPCATIRWAYNPAGGYAGAQAHVQEAFARIAQRTGLTFSYVGETQHIEKTGTTFPANADIAVGWANEAQVPDLAGSVVGLGGGSATATAPGSDVAYRFVRGYVVLDNGHSLREGYDTSGTTTWGQVMIHEQLHALGLGHATGAEQVMFGSSSFLNHSFGAGDLTGMARVGAGQGCL